MSNGFKLDEEAVYDQLAKTELMHAENQAHTFYAVVCQHDRADGVASHGGFILPSAKEAVDTAKRANDTATEDHTCWYTPIAIALTPAVAFDMAKQQEQVAPDDQIGGDADAG